MPSAFSVVLVALQLAALAFLIFTGPAVAAHPAWFTLEAAAILLGLWALAVMKFRHLHVFPEVRPNGRLVVRGPYRYIRHPMYTAVLLFALALVLNAFTLPRLAVWTILLLDMLAKLNYEERLLTREYKGYAEYKQRTWRLVPYIY